MPSTIIAAKSSSWLILPSPGLTIWVLVVFGISMFILSRLVFPRIRAALDERAAAIAGSIDAAQRTREEAEQVLAEYRERLSEARGQAEEIVKRARQSSEAHEQKARENAKQIAADGAARAAREIEEATRRALHELREEVAELTVQAAEKVTRKALDDADQRRLVDEALKELDFSAVGAGADGS
ncbi:MAG: F0F1 ATP synthase subunit B [Acidobacteriota bacterium]|nr:F0F1 ATP synthase subunit B [Acidobacteriota bacterium]